MILSVVVYKAGISGGEIWQRHGFSCKIHNADFSNAYVVCGTNEISLTEVGDRKFCDPCGAGTRN